MKENIFVCDNCSYVGSKKEAKKRCIVCRGKFSEYEPFMYCEKCDVYLNIYTEKCLKCGNHNLKKISCDITLNTVAENDKKHI